MFKIITNVVLALFFIGIDSCFAECETQQITADDIDAILKAHNVLRAKVANGEQDGQPSAANMKELVWDDDLAGTAQAWADSGNRGHDTNENRLTDKYPHVGQNIIGAVFETSKSSKPDWAEGVQRLYNEVKDFDPELVPHYIFAKKYGHYSQVVWADTEAVGCGYVSEVTEGYDGWCSANIICNYGPAGNWGNEAVYKEGSPASECADGQSDTYPGLCNP